MENKKTTMQDIATELKISRVTVSKAFKGSTEISTETKEKIFQVAKELNYNYRTASLSKVLVLVNSFAKMSLTVNSMIYSPGESRVIVLQ